jgi:hypothetical protein
VGFLRRSSPKPTSPQDVESWSDQLRKAGADLTVPHVTRHFLYVPGVKAAQQVARRLKTTGRSVDIETSARRGFWLVVVSQSMVLTTESLASVRTELEAVAQSVGGHYDRWQVDLAAG